MASPLLMNYAMFCEQSYILCNTAVSVLNDEREKTVSAEMFYDYTHSYLYLRYEANSD